MEISSYTIYIYDLNVHYVTNLSKNFQTICSPEKNMCNLKNFLPQEFQWSRKLFTPEKSHTYLNKLFSQKAPS